MTVCPTQQHRGTPFRQHERRDTTATAQYTPAVAPDPPVTIPPVIMHDLRCRAARHPAPPAECRRAVARKSFSKNAAPPGRRSFLFVESGRRRADFVPRRRPSRAALCPHSVKNPLRMSFPEKSAFGVEIDFCHPSETRGFRGGFSHILIKTGWIFIYRAANRLFMPLMLPKSPLVYQGGFTAFCQGVLSEKASKRHLADCPPWLFRRFQTIFPKSLQKCSPLC